MSSRNSRYSNEPLDPNTPLDPSIFQSLNIEDLFRDENNTSSAFVETTVGNHPYNVSDISIDTQCVGTESDSPRERVDSIDEIISKLYRSSVSDLPPIAEIVSDVTHETSEELTTTDHETSEEFSTIDPSPEARIIVADEDVLIGQSPHFREHPGNKFFAELVQINFENYESSSKKQKTELTRDIIRIIRRQNRRFLKPRGYSKNLPINEIEWEEIVTEKEQNQKVASRFRDKRKKPSNNTNKRKARNSLHGGPSKSPPRRRF